MLAQSHESNFQWLALHSEAHRLMNLTANRWSRCPPWIGKTSAVRTTDYGPDNLLSGSDCVTLLGVPQELHLVSHTLGWTARRKRLRWSSYLFLGKSFENLVHTKPRHSYEVSTRARAQRVIGACAYMYPCVCVRTQERSGPSGYVVLVSRIKDNLKQF